MHAYMHVFDFAGGDGLDFLSVRTRFNGSDDT